jgi:hypothetical protein
MRGSVGNVIAPVPENLHADDCVMSSNVRLASTGFRSQPNSAELVNSIGINGRGDWAALVRNAVITRSEATRDLAVPTANGEIPRFARDDVGAFARANVIS